MIIFEKCVYIALTVTASNMKKDTLSLSTIHVRG